MGAALLAAPGSPELKKREQALCDEYQREWFSPLMDRARITLSWRLGFIDAVAVGMPLEAPAWIPHEKRRISSEDLEDAGAEDLDVLATRILDYREKFDCAELLALSAAPAGRWIRSLSFDCRALILSEDFGWALSKKKLGNVDLLWRGFPCLEALVILRSGGFTLGIDSPSLRQLKVGARVSLLGRIDAPGLRELEMETREGLHEETLEWLERAHLPSLERCCVDGVEVRARSQRR